MTAFIMANLATIIISLVLAAVLALITIKLVRDNRSGKCIGGCPDCSNCSGCGMPAEKHTIKIRS